MKDVKLINIQKTFSSLRRGKVNALKGINLEIDKGKFFVLLGPSGCGKSTLLNIIAGIEKQSEGEIYFGNKLIASAKDQTFLSPKERDIAMVFQSYALYPHMTVYNNIAFPLKIAKLNKTEIDKKVNDAANKLELSQMLDAKPAELSGGQRQRVALGRAIVRQPNVLLLDEPLSNLDAMLRITMRSELKSIQKELNLTTLYVTHDQTEAMSLGDSIAVLNNGEVQQTGSPTEIYDNPANLFVAKFMGTPPLNVFENKTLDELKQKFDIKENVTLGIRPEKIKIVDKEKGKLKVKVKMISNTGSEKIIYLSIDDKEILAKTSERIKINENEVVGINFEVEDLLAFDNNSQSKIQLKNDVN